VLLPEVLLNRAIAGAERVLGDPARLAGQLVLPSVRHLVHRRVLEVFRRW
jgi:hypothetical protein